jgi:hypothetical protein
MYFAFLLFSKRLLRKAQNDPCGQVTLSAGWLARRYYKGEDPAQLDTTIVSDLESLTDCKIDVTHLLVNVTNFEYRVEALQVRLTITTPAA